MRSDDRIRVHHMLDAAQEAVGFVENKTPRTLSRTDCSLLVSCNL